MYAMRYAGAAVVVSVGLCLVLIPTVGLVGAAIATAVGYATLAVLSLRRSQMLSRAEFQLGKVGRVFLLGGALMPVGLVHLSSEAATIAAKVAAFAVFVAGLWLLGVFGRVESGELRAAMTTLRTRIGRELPPA
jgi:O-antigen/teichoic acid export membrane protein